MNLERLKSALSTGGEHLGDLIFWSISDARIGRTTLESVWAGAGLDPALLPEPVTAEKSIKLAVREAQLGVKDRLIRVGKSDAHELVFADVREDRDGDGNVSFSQEARIQLDRHREVVTTDAPMHDLVVAVTAGFQTLRTTHTPDDVRRMVLGSLVALAAVPLRPSGGIYFVPAVYAEKLRRLQGAVEKIGSSRIFLLPVHKSLEGDKTLGAIAKGNIESELLALQAEIAAFVQAPPDRPSTLVRRFDAFSDLRSKAKLYRDILAVEVHGLDDQLDKLSGAVEDLLQQKNQEAA